MKIICTENEKASFIEAIILNDCEYCPIYEFCSKIKNVGSCREIAEEKIDWEVENE